jgi:hypothetical protein
MLTEAIHFLKKNNFLVFLLPKNKQNCLLQESHYNRTWKKKVVHEHWVSKINNWIKNDIEIETVNYEDTELVHDKDK